MTPNHENRSRPDDPLITLRAALRGAPSVTAAEERALIGAARSGHRASMDRLVRSHLRLVVSIAREHQRFGLPIEDMVSEGCIGLVQAVEKFDLDRPTRFAAYAAWWVRAYIREYTLRNRRIVPMPSTRAARRLVSSLRPTELRLTQELGRVPSAAEIADTLGVGENDVRMVDRALAARDVAVAPDGDSAMALLDRGPSPEEEAAERELDAQNTAALDAALAVLTPRERAVVVEHHLSRTPRSFAEIGRKWGVSRERARQIEQRARAKMQALLRAVA